METFRRVVAIACIGLFTSLGLAFGADDPNLANHYFGHIEAPCADTSKCKEFIDLVKRAAQETQCNRIGEHCEVGEKILERLFGTVYRKMFPDFIVYLDDSNGTPGEITLTKHRPLLMWDGENTPHLLGVRSIYVLAFSHQKIDVGATLTADYQYQPNPLIAILSVLKAPEIKGAEEKESKTDTGTFTWLPLSGDEDNAGMWLGTARIDVAPNTINRIKVFYRQPEVTVSTATTTATATTTTNGADFKTIEEIKKTESDATNKKKYKSDFLGVAGHFSNSPANYVAVSLALGATFGIKGTSTSTGGSNTGFNGFVLAKVYPLPSCRPYLYATPRDTLFRPSCALVFGTNINGKIFDEVIAGLSLGHLFGNVGLIGGANFFAKTEGMNEGRKPRLFFGLDYTF